MIKRLFFVGLVLVVSLSTIQGQKLKKITYGSNKKAISKIDKKTITLDKLVRIKTISTYTGVSSTLFEMGYYFKSKNDTYSLFTNGKDEIYYFPGSGNDGTGVYDGDIESIKEKISVQFLFNSESLYEDLIKQSYNYLGAKLYKQHTEANGNMITIMETTDFVFIFGENLEKTDDLNYKVFIISRSNFTE